MNRPSAAPGWASVLLAACAGGVEDPSGAPQNHAPTASLRVPVLTAVGEPTTLDARQSSDPDNDPLTYLFDVGDGAGPRVSTEAVLEHTFLEARIYSVRLRVLDVHGDESIALQDITAMKEYEPGADYCRVVEDCAVGDECDAGMCYLSGGTLE